LARNSWKPLIVATWIGGFYRQLRSANHPAEVFSIMEKF